MNKLVLDNLNYKMTETVPVWLMRQAGRYMKEYHIVKNKFNGFMEMCKNSDAVTEITLQPIKRFDLDSAIIFSDILMVPYALGQEVNFIKERGPKLSEFDQKTFFNNTEKTFFELVKVSQVLKCGWIILSILQEFVKI